jgi:integrase
MAGTKSKRVRGRKRGHGEGSIYQRGDGLWAASLMVGRKANGRPDRRVLYRKTRAVVQQKLDALRGQVSQGLVVEPHQLTVADFFTQWLRDSVALTSRPATYRLYASLIRTHVLLRLGAMRLTVLRPAHLQQLYADLVTQGKATGTVTTLHAAIHRALVQAVSWGYVVRSPAEAVDRPAARSPEMQVLSLEQTQTLLCTAEEAGHPDSTLWRLLLDAGARIGEALAVTWPDVDLERGTIAIRRTLTHLERGGVPVFGEPKTAASRRIITLMPATVAALRGHRSGQLAERLAAGPAYADHDLVFAAPDGRPLREQTCLRRLRRALRAAGTPGTLRLHDLRHTAATLML